MVSHASKTSNRAAPLDCVLEGPPANETYVIEKIIDYHPRKGFFVHWRGFPDSERTWQKPSDMPLIFRSEMDELKRAHRENFNTVTKPAVGSTAEQAVPSSKGIPGSTKSVGVRGSESYIIDQVLDYDKGKGFLVSWVGFGPEANSWQLFRDMPSSLGTEMKHARRRATGKTATPVKRSISKASIETSARPTKVASATRVPSAKRSRAAFKAGVLADAKMHSVISYDPARGFLVHWRGFPQSEDSWVSEDDVAGDKFRSQMLLARERYVDNLVSVRTPDAP